MALGVVASWLVFGPSGARVPPAGVQPAGEAVPTGHQEVPHADAAHHQHQGRGQLQPYTHTGLEDDYADILESVTLSVIVDIESVI